MTPVKVKSGDINLDRILSMYSEVFLACRAAGHNWKAYRVVKRTGKRGRILCYIESMICDNCDCQRKRVILPDGTIDRSWYVHPKNYVLAGMKMNTGKMRSRVRLEFINRMNPQEESEEDFS